MSEDYGKTWLEPGAPGRAIDAEVAKRWETALDRTQRERNAARAVLSQFLAAANDMDLDPRGDLAIARDAAAMMMDEKETPEC